MGLASFNRARRLKAEKERKPIAKEPSTDSGTEEECDLETMTVPELKEIAKEKNVSGYGRMKKDELIKALKG